MGDLSNRSKIALLGFSIPAMEGLDSLGRPFVAVVPPDFEGYMKEHDIPHVLWDYSRNNEQSRELAETLSQMGAGVACPLFEETVAWAGAVNGFFRDDPRLFTRYLLFRDKAMMKRRAQMHGIRVGVFEEAETKDDVLRFLKRVKQAMAKLDTDEDAPVHLKPKDAAGAYGHVMIRSPEDVQDKLDDDSFPCLLETHLDGQEFSCEVFVHAGKIRFLNITEYVRLGHSNFVPASDELWARRELIRRAAEKLIRAFDIEYGMIHPEFFVDSDDQISFGEVAARVPGGHIFELIQKSYGFDPFAGFAICCDPETTEEELEEFFPDESENDGYSGCVMVYPRSRVVTRVHVPDELLKDPYYDKHNLFVPSNPKVAERVAYGDHYGSIFFKGPESGRMRELIEKYEDYDFYLSDPPGEAPEDAGEAAAG